MESSSAPTPVSLEGLLIHAEWVRGLARALVRDEATASDVEQEVWREAIERPPQSTSNVRGWLAQVARNAARMQVRSSRRAQAREMTAARPEALPSTLDVVAEAELSRSLAGRVIALAEPYRTTLLLRYFRGHTVDEIAEQQGVSRETVRTRQRRGLELLRTDLDATHASRADWLSALAPLVRSARPVATVGVAGALMWKMLLAATIVVVAWRAWREPHTAPTASTTIMSPTSEKLASASEDGAMRAKPAETTESASDRRNAIQAPYPPRAPPAPASTIDAQLYDLKGQPFVGFEVEYRLEHEPHWQADGLDMGDEEVSMSAEVRKQIQDSPKEIDRFLEEFPSRPGLREVLLGQTPLRPRAVSSEDGSLHVALPQGTWKRFVLAERLAIVTEFQPEGTTVARWILAPCIHVAGTVVDEEGAPVSDANVQASTHIEDLALFGGESVGESQTTNVLCDDQGHFDMPCTPITPELDATVYAHGFVPRSLPGLAHDDLALRIVLKHEKTEQRPHIRGTVLDENGAPVAKASVLFGQNNAATDDRGSFDIEIGYSQPGDALQAVKAGYQSTAMPPVGQYKMTTIDGVVLRLGPAALSIGGRVLDRNGAKVAGAHVQLIDGTPAGSNTTFLEDIADGHWQLGVKSDADGRFELGGLSARTYRLIAWMDKRGLIAISAPIEAGSTNMELRASAEAFQDHLKGRVMSRRGVPLGNVDVSIELPIFATRGSTHSILYGRVSTDAAGRFELHDVPYELVQLWVSGRAIRTDSVHLPVPRTDDIEVIAAIEMRVRLEVADAAVDRLTFLDENGKTASVEAHFPHTESQQYELDRVDGAFAEFSVTDEVATIVLKHGESEVRRVPLDVHRQARVTLQL